MTPTIVIILAIILVSAIIAGTGAYIYRRHRQQLLLLSGEPAALLEFGVEALGGFSAGRVTALSTSAIPGMPYDVSLFAGKALFEPVIPEGVKKKKQWIRHGEVKPANIGMNRF